MKTSKLVFYNIGVFFIVFIMLCGILEIGLRLFAPQPVSYFAFPKTPRPDQAVPCMGTKILLNSYGSRDTEHAVARKDGINRILTIGDSVTFGFGVELSESYPKVLEKLLNESSDNKEYEVISLNRPGSDTKWALDKYIKSGKQFKPDVVIYGFCLRHILDYSNFKDNNGILKPRTTLVRAIMDSLLIFHYQARIHSHLYYFVMERSKPLLYRNFLNIRTKNPEYWIPLEVNTPEFKKRFVSTIKEINLFRNEVVKNGSKFIVVVFPYEIQLGADQVKLYEKAYRLDIYKDAPKAETQKMLIAEFLNNNIKYIDLLGTFRAYSKNQVLYFRSLVGIIDWIHPNVKGHKIAADVIATYLKNTIQLN